mmetsp:Transcript_90513/g.230236  ORF Transcript_90513/g.230236 Transcript_90513/m.230236 type:complete len:84 (-) Transcript_90513:716-967(-)
MRAKQNKTMVRASKPLNVTIVLDMHDFGDDLKCARRGVYACCEIQIFSWWELGNRSECKVMLLRNMNAGHFSRNIPGPGHRDE